MPNNHIMIFQWEGLQDFAIGKTLKYEGGKTIAKGGKVCDSFNYLCSVDHGQGLRREICVLNLLVELMVESISRQGERLVVKAFV
jgi:hypothetical protein